MLYSMSKKGAPGMKIRLISFSSTNSITHPAQYAVHLRNIQRAYWHFLISRLQFSALAPALAQRENGKVISRLFSILLRSLIEI